MKQTFRMKDDSRSLSEYALNTWAAMTDAGMNPLDSLFQIQSEIETSHSAYDVSEKENALRLIDRWKGMLRTARGRYH